MKDAQITIRGMAALDAELAKAERAKQQEPEEAMMALLDEMGMIYDCQFPYVSGRKLRADFAIWRILQTPSAFGSLGRTRVCLVEIVGGIYPFRRTRKDGSEVILPGAHGTVAGIKADCERLNEASIAGWLMLRFLPEQVRNGYARMTLERLLLL